ncbi:MAG: FUSC family protein [Nocardioides sp.]
MPDKTRDTVRALVHLRPAPGSHRVALRAGVSVLVPQLVVLGLGHPDWSAYAVFGAFASLYGRNHVHLSRAAMQASAGLALTLSVVLGVLAGAAPGRAWVAVVGAAAVAVAGGVVAGAQDWHPPGPLFLVFGFGAVASVPHHLADIPAAAVVAGLSALFAVVVGNVGGFVRRRHRTRPVALRPVRLEGPVRCGVAVLVAGALATAVGIGHPYWATVAAVAPLSAPDRSAQIVRALHRVVGTLLGMVTATLLLLPGLDPVPTVLVVVLLQVVTEMLVGRNYALALVFITPMALLMGQVVAPRPVGPLLADRMVETLLGAAVGIAVILVAGRRPRVAA